MASSRNPGEVRDQPPPDTPGRAKNDKAPRSSRTRALQVDPRVDLSHRRGRVLASLEQFKDMLASLRRAQSRGGGDGRSSHQQAPCAPCPSPAVVILTAAEYAKGAQDEDTSAEVGEKRKGGDDGVPDAPPGRKLLRLSREERAAKKSMFGSERALLEKLHFEREFDHQGLLDTLADRDLRHIYKHNPHLRQVFVEGYDLYRVARPFGAEDRYITDADGQTRWRGRASEVITVEHWGQRKLIISEIEFLTEFHSPGRTVVYVGAAPGSHINFLATVLFPDLLFVLVDPAPFEAWPAENVEIRNEYFDSEAARKFLGADCLLISDIRGREVDDMAAEEREEVVLEEMMLQKEWVKLMRPAGASLKFRLPYLRSKCPSVRYLDGRLYLPVWGGRTTSESRLFVTDPDSEKEYDVQTYDNTMFHFNISTRVSYFEEKRGEAEGFDHCYDCMAECFVLQQYLRKMHDIKDDDVLHSGSGRLSNMLSRAIGSRGRNRIGWSGGEKYAFK